MRARSTATSFMERAGRSAVWPLPRPGLQIPLEPGRQHTAVAPALAVCLTDTPPAWTSDLYWDTDPEPIHTPQVRSVWEC